MTVRNLHRVLGKMIEAGHGRTRVLVNKDSFTHPLESDGCVMIDAHHVELKLIPMIDDDGGSALDSKGRERTIKALVIDGGNDPALFADSSI